MMIGLPSDGESRAVNRAVHGSASVFLTGPHTSSWELPGARMRAKS